MPTTTTTSATFLSARANDTAADADAMNASKMANYGTRVPPHCRDRDEEGVIRPGCHVNIKGLQGRTDLNGKMGIVGHYFDAEKLRWAVEMADTGEGVKVRPSNICVAPSQPAGVSSAEEWLKAVVPEGMKFPPKLSTDEAMTTKGTADDYAHFWAERLPSQLAKLERLCPFNGSGTSSGSYSYLPGELYLFSMLYQCTLVDSTCLAKWSISSNFKPAYQATMAGYATASLKKRRFSASSVSPGTVSGFPRKARICLFRPLQW